MSLSADTILKLESMANEENVSLSSIVERAVNDYYEKTNIESQEVKEMLSNMEKELRRIRIIGNGIDRDTKMLLEFWNHYFVVNEFNELATTEKYKTKELIEAEELISKRIVKDRQRRLDAKSK